MCYKKPGPRCSNHAKAALDKAKVTYLADPSFQNYTEMRDAEEEYYLTLGGQALIRRKISEASSYEEKYELNQKLDNVIKLRKNALKKIKTSDQGDLDNHPAATLPYVKTKYGLIKDGLPYDPQEILFNNYTPVPYVEYETDGSYCPDLRSHNDDYCRDSILVNVYASPTTDEEYLRQVFSLPDNSSVPQEWLKQVKNVGGVQTNLIVEVVSGYYGQEVGYSGPNSKLLEVTDNIFYGSVNAADHLKILPYVRSKGVDTSGMKPVDALKSIISKNKIAEQTADKVKEAGTASVSIVDLRKVDTSQLSIPAEVEYDFSEIKINKDKPYAGVVIKEGYQYILVEGAANFKAASDNGTSNKWPMVVLSV